MAYIRKHGDRWRAEIQKHGQRASKVFPTKREAQAWAIQQESRADSLKKSSGYTFGQAADRYMREVSTKKRGQQWEVRRLLVMVEHFGENTPLVDIDVPQIAAWRDARLKTVTASTVVREGNVLRHLWRTAMIEWRWVEHDAMKGVRWPAENDARHQRWGWREIRRILRAGQASSGKTREVAEAFHIALRTSMRLSEVLAAPPGFDPKRRVVTLPKTKTETRPVEVPIGRIAAKLLARPPFTVGPNEASTLFAKLCKSQLITGLTFHDSRGSALTWLSRKVDVMTLAKISRHKDLSLLQRVYYRETAEEIARRL